MFASMLMMLCGNVLAGEVTFDPTTDKGPAGTEGGTLTKDGITLTLTKGTLADNPEYRIYKSQTFTVSSSVGNITKIVMTCPASDDTKWGPGCFGTGAPEGYSYEGTTGTWEGNASEVAFRTVDNQVRITTLVVTVDEDSPVEVKAPKPIISPNGGEFEESTSIRIYVEDEEHENVILYSLNDGDEQEYTAPFTITETTTVKARVKALWAAPNIYSDYVTATFTKVAAPEHITVARALEIIEGMENGKTTNEKYVVKGYVKTISEVSTQHGNATFTIVDAAGDEQALTIFRAKYLENAAFTREDQLKQGNLVEVQGQLQKYVKNSVVTPELSYGYLLSIEEGLADNIGTVKAEKAQQGIFNLQGQRVEKAGKGLYIVGGKKVIF